MWMIIGLILLIFIISIFIYKSNTEDNHNNLIYIAFIPIVILILYLIFLYYKKSITKPIQTKPYHLSTPLLIRDQFSN